VTRSSFRTIDRQVTLGFVVALSILLTVMAYAHARAVAMDAATEWVGHSHLVLETLATVDVQRSDAQAAQRGYLLTGERGYLVSYRTTARAVDTSLARLRTLTLDNIVQQRRVDTLWALGHHLLTELDDVLALAEVRGRDAARGAMAAGHGDTLESRVRALNARMAVDERVLLARRAAWQVRERRAARGAALFGALAVVVLAVAAAVRVRSALAVRARAEWERDRHAEALALQTAEVTAQNEELIAQGQALQQAMDEAEAANTAKSMFVAQMSHELRTPLNSVIGFANIVRRNPHGALSAAELTYLDRIAENGRQLLHTINSILDLSKIEAEQESVALDMVSLDPLVREVLAQLEPQATAGQVHLAAEIPAPLASIVSDTEKLRRVLINLVANAVKFTRPGGRVVVRVETGPRAPTTPVAIEVRDTGIGIAPERLAMIFDAFEQGDVGVGREYGGTGLGLSISRSLCRLLHCELTVSSVVGRGSVFRIGLPHDGVLTSAPVDLDLEQVVATASGR
jgi:signal transduction histidine kinase